MRPVAWLTRQVQRLRRMRHEDPPVPPIIPRPLVRTLKGAATKGFAGGPRFNGPPVNSQQRERLKATVDLSERGLRRP